MGRDGVPMACVGCFSKSGTDPLALLANGTGVSVAEGRCLASHDADVLAAGVEAATPWEEAAAFGAAVTGAPPATGLAVLGGTVPAGVAAGRLAL